MTPALTADQLERYHTDGYLVCEGAVPDELVEQARDELLVLIDEDGPHRFMEADSVTVRAIYGLHDRAGVWQELAYAPSLHGAATELLDGPTYLFQWKINPKAGSVGERWEWHRDFDFWYREDGVPEPLMVTAALFLDDVTPDNGPMVVVPGSHRVVANLDASESETGEDGWDALVSSSLKYTVADEEIAAYDGESEPRAVCGPRGTVMFFHPNLVHSSSANTSAARRALGFLTYNLSANAPDSPRRPGFFVNHDTSPISAKVA
jgi:ectoine hydroxylase